MADPGRRLGPNAVAVLVLITLGAALLLWQRPWQSPAEPTVALPADAPARLTAQFRELTQARSEREFVAAAGTTPTARAFAHQAWGARQALSATGVELRYVTGGDVADRADGTAVASVDVSWRAGAGIGLTDATEHTSSVAFRVAPQDNGDLSIVGVSPQDGALPIWLAGPVEVERGAGAAVIRVDGGDDLPIEAMAASARAAVARVVPGSTDDVTVVSPRTQRQMARLVGQPVGAVRQIAAVTTRLDARDGTAADTVIVLNPAVFSTMDRRASQVVLTHEATHLLTGAVGTQAESWVVEGFADFVALHDDSAPLAVSAGQILAEVQAGDVPDHLPTAGDFESTSHGLGAVYESTWLVFRLLAERHGDAKVVDFYERVIDGKDLDRALQSSFGLDAQELTEDWQDYLAKSASTVS